MADILKKIENYKRREIAELRGHRGLGERCGQLRQPESGDGSTEQRGIVMGDERAGDDHFDPLVAIEERPGSD